MLDIYAEDSKNLRIKENIILPKTPKIGIREFQFIHSTTTIKSLLQFDLSKNTTCLIKRLIRFQVKEELLTLRST